MTAGLPVFVTDPLVHGLLYEVQTSITLVSSNVAIEINNLLYGRHNEFIYFLTIKINRNKMKMVGITLMKTITNLAG